MEHRVSPLHGKSLTKRSKNSLDCHSSLREESYALVRIPIPQDLSLKRDDRGVTEWKPLVPAPAGLGYAATVFGSSGFSVPGGFGSAFFVP
uniref:Uncharacterized protein n=1 Tax=Candidatus Kentrum sp. TUN TaxID=2126343 RepID=A0A451AEZ7_9GAMM|nr:MAG: hypothetical protein BECKTUN1418D_GA0071000_12765 [Candidatus Kentron sp. TUN]